MRGTLVAIAACGVLCAAAPDAADAQLILQNDDFNGSGRVGAQGGFAPGEMAASRFVAPTGGRTLQSVTFFFGGASGQRTITLHVYDDSSQAINPGGELHNADYQVMGSDSALTSIDLSATNVVVPAFFRVAVELHTAGAPSLARDNNGIVADRNFLYGDLLGGTNFIWNRSEPLLQGDWIIRATVSDSGGGGIDAGIDAAGGSPDAAGTSPDASSSGGCQGNGDCAIGSYCNTADNSCTFDCRNDGDCGSGACNSLGQCVVGDDAGGSCSTGSSGGVAGAIGLGAAVALLLGRRRRRR